MRLEVRFSIVSARDECSRNLIDLDSIASSVAYAWFASTSTGNPHIAILQTARRDLKLRPENIYAFSLASLTTELQELLCIDEVPSAPFPSDKFALVDHNRLLSKFTESAPASVVAVIDHHEDEGLYTDTASPRLIQVPTGSCTSLVTLHILNTAGPDVHVPPELATFLLCGILIDTNGLKEGGKAVQADHDAAAFLVPRSSLALPKSPQAKRPLDVAAAPLVRNLATELRDKKSAVEHLTTLDLLRRDYKQYAIQSSWTPGRRDVHVGLATVPLPLESWMPKDTVGFWREVDTFMDENGLHVLGILTSFSAGKKKKKGKRSFSLQSLTEVPWTGKRKGEKKKEKEEKEEKKEKKEKKGKEGKEEKEEKKKEKERKKEEKKKEKKEKKKGGKKRKTAGRQALFIVRELAEGGLEERLWAGVESSDFGFERWDLEEFAGNSMPNGGVGERKARAYEQGDAKQTRKTIAPLVRRIIEGPSEIVEAK